ncbi:DNA-binding protein [Morganella morganii]|uniref:DNA-binding protein n=1 Tax=Morganella morganii TaxID=582 RepID=UPI0010531D8A|nr:DNA-binding protein [Morganella morganii]ELA9130827.1 DNA-binding protein [Morganella morganii]MBS9569152.1 DNA-binding protein [Morganella morganii subsp. morganii]MDU3419314.1 DNA-binding protein [Morganella morganii]MDU3449593.1 DNA-binding protein [Morganella morganii]MDU3506699.1 DNA-binding protein [Morganella morganii]
MATLSQYYKHKDKNGTGTTVKKAFMVPYDELYLEPGDNIRPLNEEHARKMCELWKSGADLPALSVQVTEKGVKIIDGQHRYIGAGYAIADGISIPRIECKDFIGTELERLAHQAGTSEGLAITPVQRAKQYNRARNAGYTIQEIADEFHRSTSDVETHLQLLSSGDELIKLVEAGEIAATTAVALSREHGPKADSVATGLMSKAKAAGKKKLTRSVALPQFSAVKARKFIQAVADAGLELDGEAGLLMEEYQAFLSETGQEVGS